MIKTKLDLKAIQNLNLFEKITHVKAKYSFSYNSIIIFAVPKALMNKAIGQKAANINKLKILLNKKTRIIAYPSSIHDLEHFIRSIIFPYKFRKLVLEQDELYIFSAPRTKAALIGRNKTRLLELSNVLEKFFGIKKVIIK